MNADATEHGDAGLQDPLPEDQQALLQNRL